MKISVRIEYFEPFGHWSWEVTVDGNSVRGFAGDHGSALAAAESALEDMMNERREA